MGAVGAAVAGGVASAAISAGAGALQKGASSGGASAANAAQTGALQQASANLQPFSTTGTNALGVAGDLSGANGPAAATAAMQNFYTDPGYQFQLDQGLRGVDAGAAAKGMLRSGATLKAEDTFAQGLAASDFDKYYNRLYDLSKLGETAAAGQGSLDVTTGAGIAGTDRAAAAQQGSIYGAAGQGLSSSVSGLFANPAVMNKLFPGSGTAGTPTNAINTTYTNPSEAAYYSAASTGSPYSFTG